MAMAFMVFQALKAPESRKAGLLRYLGLWRVGGAVVSSAGFRWWDATLPESVLNLFAVLLLVGLATVS